MVACSVIGCSNRTMRDTVRFFRFPNRKEFVSEEKTRLISLRRNMWLMRVGRQDLFDDQRKTDLQRVCSKHFVNGQPAHSADFNDVDWAPSLHLGHNYFNKSEKVVKRKGRYKRKKKVEISKEEEEEENPEVDSVKEENTDSNVTIIYLKTEKS